MLTNQANDRQVSCELPASHATAAMEPDVTNPADGDKKIEGILASVSRHEAEYSFEPTPLVDCAVLFAPGQVQGSHTTIRLNTLHPAFPLFAVLLTDEDAGHPSDEAELRVRYREARAALQLLIESWTRMEGDLTGVRERRASELREDWGRVARQLLNGD
jgi:hypothetical protein